MNFWTKRKIRRTFRKTLNQLKNWRHNDDDILTDSQKAAFDRVLADGADIGREDLGRMEEFSGNAVERVQAVIPPKSCRALREWLDIIAVAMAVAFGIRGLFFQPFKIPTGSMQPTLFGIHFMAKDNSNKLMPEIPGLMNRLLFAASPVKVTVQSDGYLDTGSFTADGGSVSFSIGDTRYTLPGELTRVIGYAGLSPYRHYRRGEVLCDGYISGGDHLFVDRLSINLFGLKRGDVVVFNTENIVSPDGRRLADVSGYYYIKRLAGLPGDTLKIVSGQLWLRKAGEKKFEKIQDVDRRFQRLYSGKGGYQGHANTAAGGTGNILMTEEEEYTVPPDSYFMLGDNTAFSADSRIWGIVPRRNITGKALFVFWPFSRRWGLADRKEALDVPTGEIQPDGFPSMKLQ